VHKIGVVLPGEDITGAAHVCRKLIDFVKAAIDNGATKAVVAQVADHEIVSFIL
jgi:hypothetical protein